MSVESPLQEYKMHSADILFKEDATVDDLIDVIEGNRRYIRCLYVFNKIDVCSIEEVDEIARRQVSIPISAGLNMNMDGLLEAIWEQMGLVRVYTKKVGSSTLHHTRLYNRNASALQCSAYSKALHVVQPIVSHNAVSRRNALFVSPYMKAVNVEVLHMQLKGHLYADSCLCRYTKPLVLGLSAIS